jgi:hypothetical protein
MLSTLAVMSLGLYIPLSILHGTSFVLSSDKLASVKDYLLFVLFFPGIVFCFFAKAAILFCLTIFNAFLR